MERLMVANPAHWQPYHGGEPADAFPARHFSYSDRIRYYWPEPAARQAVDRLLRRLDGRRIPEALVRQHLGALYPEVAAGRVRPEAEALLIAAVQRVLRQYRDAASPVAPSSESMEDTR
jgi:D-tagatose-1,6-bisphosphate aldolase subunit GatZ/KbaZ